MKFSCNHHVESFDLASAQGDEYTEALSGESLLIPVGTYTFVYDYPLKHVARFQHDLTPEMSKIDILLLGSVDYKTIYALEDAASGKTGHIPGMLNRQTSAGPYGIWGHDISDLYFESVDVNYGSRIVEFGIGS
jgi:hypothetical protein